MAAKWKTKGSLGIYIDNVLALTITAAGIAGGTISYVNTNVSGALGVAGTMNMTIAQHVAAPTDQYPWDYVADWSGDPSGTTSYRTMRVINRLSGTADVDQVHVKYAGHMDQRVLRSGVKPTTFVAFAHHFYILNQRDGDILNASVAYAHIGVGSHDWDSSGNFGTVDIYRAGDSAWIVDHIATGIAATINGFVTGQLGHALRVNNLRAFYAEDDVALNSATAFQSAYAAGPGKLAFKDIGGAGSQFVGAVGIGDTVLPVNTMLSIRRVAITLGTADNTGSALNVVATITPNADGLSDFRNLRQALTINGGNGFANASGINNVITVAHTAGTGTAVPALVSQITYSGAGPLTTARALSGDVRLGGDGAMTNGTAFYGRVQKTAGTTGTIANTRGAHIDDGGGAHVTGFAIGLDIENFANITGGGVNAAVRTKTNAGTGRNALRTEGSALSSLAGGLRVGSNVDPVAMLDVTGTIAASSTVTATGYRVGSNQVVGARDTGWTAMTGTPDKATAYATSSVTLPQLAGRVMALQQAWTTHGGIGA